MKKKVAHSSFVAVVHLVIGGFIIPLIGYGLLYFVISTLFPGFLESNEYGLLFDTASRIVATALLIGGIMYSSDYIAEKYVIKEARVIIIKSTYYFGLLLLLGSILEIWVVLDNQIVFGEWLLNLVVSIINVALFYYASERFLPKYLLKHTH